MGNLGSCLLSARSCAKGITLTMSSSSQQTALKEVRGNDLKREADKYTTNKQQINSDTLQWQYRNMGTRDWGD